MAINVDYRRTMKPVDDILYRIDPGLCAIPYYKEAGSDLGVLSAEQPWLDISQDRMNDVKERYDSKYVEADGFSEQYEPERAVPLLMAS